jgi:hypothetical protein
MTITDIFSLTNGTHQSSAGNPFAHVGKAAGVASADGVFTPARSGVGTAPSASKVAVGVPADKVELSGLAQALTGRAAEFFAHMDDKERGKLESLVKSGQVSVDDAVKGLEFWADEVTFMKAMTLVPSTVEEQEQARQRDSARAAFDANFKEFATVSRENEARVEEYISARETGSGDVADAREQLDEVSQRFQAEWAKVQQSREAMGDTGLVFQQAFKRRSDVVIEAKAASGHPDGAVRSNSANKAAADKLSEAGLGQLDLKNARHSFAASITQFPY